MLLNLVKKDYLLVKKYMIIMFFAALMLPIGIRMKTEFLVDGGLIPFFISTLFIQFLIFNSVSMLEYKYKGSALLSATPYTRNALVISKYLFLLVIFVACYILYTVTALLLPKHLEVLHFSEFGTSFLILTIFFSILIPTQYYFGFEKAKFISFFIIFITPFVSPVVVDYIQSSNLNFHLPIPAPEIVQDLMLFLLTLAIGLISMIASIGIYKKQNL